MEEAFALQKELYKYNCFRVKVLFTLETCDGETAEVTLEPNQHVAQQLHDELKEGGLARWRSAFIS